MVRPEDTIDDTLKEHPGVLDELARKHPVAHHIVEDTQNFQMAPRITWEMLAKMLGISIDDLMEKLYQRLGKSWQRINKKVNFNDTAVAADFEGRNPVEFDVRSMIDARIDPFQAIFEKLDALEPGDYLELVNYFEPIPLYTVLSARGFVWNTKQEGFVWRVKIVPGFMRSRRKAEMGEASYVPVEKSRLDEIFQSIALNSPECYRELDVRELPAPEPLSKIIECFRETPQPLAIKVFHRRKPDLLPKVAADYSMLVSVHEEKGCTCVYVYAASLLDDEQQT